MYKVIKYFTDLQDNSRPYDAGDIFPRPGLVVSKERFAELAGSENKRGESVIMLVKEEQLAAVKKEQKKTTKKSKETAKE